MQIPFWANSNPVDPTRAITVAQNFYQSVTSGPMRGAAEIVMTSTYAIAQGTRNETEVPCFYVVNMGSNGYVIVSADDCAKPVLAYSTEGAFTTESIPAGLSDILEGYRNEIGTAIAHAHTATEEVSAQWEEVRNPLRATRTVIVEPLIQTTWNQSPYYNNMCPDYTYEYLTSGPALTGCVATALAQIIRYWEWPVRGNSSHTYHAYSSDDNPVDLGNLTADFGNTIYLYDLMPTAIDETTHSLLTDQVARLSLHCGIATNMQYGHNGSGALSEEVPHALRTYFDYSCKMRDYLQLHSISLWEEMLKEDLDNGMPVDYSGSDGETGHAFVCDGYDEANYFHFNFGWGGYGNAYFTVSGTDVHEYSNGQAACFGIRPNRPEYGDNSCSITIEASHKIDNQTGWNGAYLVIYHREKAIRGITLLPEEHAHTYTVNVPEDSLHFEWFSGTEDGNCRFLIRGADADTLYYSDGGQSAGRFFSTNYACSQCPIPINLNVNNIEEREATLSWTSGGSPQSYSIEYGPTGFTPGTGTLVSPVQSPYTIEHLSPEHTYDAYVQALCNDSTASDWSAASTFTTSIYCGSDNNRTISSFLGNSGTPYIPINYYDDNHYSYSQQLYTGAELNAYGLTDTCKINSIAFRTYGFSNQTLDNISIYIGHSPIETFYTIQFLPFEQMTLVYSGSVQFHSGNYVWNEIQLQNPFLYDGSSNLVIAVLNNAGTMTANPNALFVSHLVNSCQCLFSTSDTPMDITELSLAAFSFDQIRNDIRFNVCFAGYTCEDVAITLDIPSCGPYEWNDTIYTEDGIYTQTLTSAHGCDSTVTIHLTILPKPEVTINGNTQIESGESTTLTASGASAYLWNTGDTTASITVSPVNTTTYTVTGTIENGCYDIASATVQLPMSVADHAQGERVSLYPNPATTSIVLQADEDGALIREITLYDAAGRVLYHSGSNVGRTEINIKGWGSGIYFARIVCGDSVIVKKFTKE